ncbi:MAG: extracellular solute-binding protein [Candidatus Omnitrophica bacterium]|nr:extracellular solute-binding protein [Candidatus Omnitrophota bacterium]
MLSAKKTFVFLALTAYMLLCAGCGERVETKNRLVVWVVGSEGEAKTITRISETFTQKTGISVVCQAISWGNAHSKYLTSIAGEVAPDIGTMGLTWGMEFGEKGAMVDLRAAFPEDIARMEKHIFPGILDSTRIGEKVFGIPYDMTEQVLFYRTDIIEDPPRTWVELMDTLEALRVQGKGMVIDWGSLEWIGFSPFLWQAGGSYYNEDHTRPTLDTPEAAEALSFFSALYKEGVPRTQVPMEQGLRTGDYPLSIAGNWKIITLTGGAPEIAGKWSIAALPKGPTGRRTAFIGGRVIGIFSMSGMKKEAWEFIKFLSTPESQTAIYEGSMATQDAYLPPNMDAWEDLPMNEEFKDVLVRQAKDAKGPPPVLAWDSSTRFVNEAIQMAIFRNADPATVLRKANEEMERELEFYR